MSFRFTVLFIQQTSFMQSTTSMKKQLFIIILLTVIVIINLALMPVFDKPVFERKQKLSEYNFFSGKLSDLQPAATVIPYDINSVLFSNYAEKLRFVKLRS